MRRRQFLLIVTLIALVAGACSVDLPGLDQSPEAAPDLLADQTAALEAADDHLVVGELSQGISWSPLLLGTNVPAWLGSGRAESQSFADAIAASGTTMLRFPGGSWSNAYDWLGCLEDDGDRCYWTWALDPSDFADIITDTGLPAMWTVSFNATPEEAAALVAYFNSPIGDTTPIGVDGSGRDWGTAGQWAERRAESGHADPVRIDWWEIGNEIYGAKPSAGSDCASWGWEDVWTCDGTDYALGAGGRPGFDDFERAMRAVDPTIAVGAVGVADGDSWGDFGSEVVEAVGDDLDFYIVHDYGFGRSPSLDEAASLPQHRWAEIAAGVAAQFADRDEPVVGITEYNLVSFLDADTEAVMRSATNLLFMADTIGRMALHGVTLANQWNIMNGVGSTGTDYGMVGADDGVVAPQLFALRLWSLMGERLLAITAHPELDVFASGSEDGSLAFLVINDTDAAQPLSVELPAGDYSVDLDEVAAAAPEARTVTYNGVAIGDVSGAAQPPLSLGPVSDLLTHTVPPWSVSVLRLTPAP